MSAYDVCGNCGLSLERSSSGFARCEKCGERTQECCGEICDCSGFTNTCPSCGADYNWAGQRLAPREQWGEETGESLSDILSIR